MIEIDKRISIDVMYHREPINLYLQQWLDILKQNKSIKVNISQSSYDICLARRQSLENFVDNDIKNGWDYLVQLDVDVCPVPTSDNLFTYPEPLIYLGQATKNGKFSHYGNDNFGCSAFRIHKSLAQKIDISNSFDFEYDLKRTSIVKCECQVFYERLKKLGYNSKMVGVIGHWVKQIIVPTEDGIVEWKYSN